MANDKRITVTPDQYANMNVAQTALVAMKANPKGCILLPTALALGFGLIAAVEIKQVLFPDPCSPSAYWVNMDNCGNMTQPGTLDTINALFKPGVDFVLSGFDWSVLGYPKGK